MSIAKQVQKGVGWLAVLAAWPSLACAAAGQLDPAFNGGGQLSLGIGFDDVATTLIQQSDGKLVAAGYSNNGSNDDFALVRYNSNGSLDATFNATGVLTADIGGSTDRIQSVIQQSDGKLVAVGQAINGAYADFAIMRLSNNGTQDVSFGNGGTVLTNFATLTNLSDVATSVIQQIDGKLVVAGISNDGVDYDFVVARYNSNGSLDTTFDGDGKVRTDITTQNEHFASVIQQPDGKLVVAGYATVAGSSNYALVAVRYNSNGSLDTTFDGDGKVTIDVDTSYDTAYQVIRQSDGKLVLAGYTLVAGATNTLLVRLNSDGSLDTTFDGDGVLITIFSAGNDQFNSVLQQADGKLLATGYACFGFGGCYVLLARYNSDGSLDATFDGDGVLVTDMAGSEDVGNALIQQIDGKYVVAGYTKYGTKDIALLRYLPDLFAINDFDRDRDSDIFWRDSNSGQNVVWNMQNGLKASTNVIGANAASYILEAIADFDADGDADVLYRDTGSGTSVIWKMQGGVKVAAAVLGSNAAAYDIKGVADFDNDGDADILFRDNSGSNVIWKIQNATKVGATVLGSNAAAYTVEAVKDFDADGDADILFRDNSTGQVVIWKIQNAAKAGVTVVGTNAASYSIKAVADFDADGDADILFRDTAGANLIWKIQATARSGVVVLGNNAVSYSVAAAVDFDADGDADILFRDDSGLLVIWTLQGAAKTGISILGSSGLNVAGVADFDGDGDGDILLRDNGTGSNVAWVIQNATKTGANVLGGNSAAMQAYFEK